MDEILSAAMVSSTIHSKSNGILSTMIEETSSASREAVEESASSHIAWIFGSVNVVRAVKSDTKVSDELIP